jgi:YgiT-type zinc finger domain-containing protein
MTEQCAFCGHQHLKPTTTRYIHQLKDELLIMDDVPCLTCEYCGEHYFEAAVLKKIEAEHNAIITHQKPPTWVKLVSVESFLTTGDTE